MIGCWNRGGSKIQRYLLSGSRADLQQAQKALDAIPQGASTTTEFQVVLLRQLTATLLGEKVRGAGVCATALRGRWPLLFDLVQVQD